MALLLAFCPGRYSAPEAGGENPNPVKFWGFCPHPCSCPWGFRVHLYGRSEEGPILMHVPPREKLLAYSPSFPIATEGSSGLGRVRFGDTEKLEPQSKKDVSPFFIWFGYVRLSRCDFLFTYQVNFTRDRRTGGPGATQERTGGDDGSGATTDPPGGKGCREGGESPHPLDAGRTLRYRSAWGWFGVR